MKSTVSVSIFLSLLNASTESLRSRKSSSSSLISPSRLLEDVATCSETLRDRHYRPEGGRDAQALDNQLPLA